MILETTRLQLRELCDDDFTDLCDMLYDEQVMYAYAHAFSFDEAKQWLERQKKRYQEDGVGLWAIIRKEDGVMVGQCGITKQYVHKQPVWEIGYLLKKAYWHMGYAREASNACKQYGFETLQLTRLYSIIRDNNEASKRVAIHTGMKKVGMEVKQYYHMNMPHEIYCIENVDVLKHVYIDAEFDAVKFHQKYHQMLISLGAVCCDGKGAVLSSFYDTIRPLHYQKTSRIVLKMTGLSEEVIRSSKPLKRVLSQFHTWLQHIDPNEDHFTYYSFGPDDKRTILQHCDIEHIEDVTRFANIKDLQKSLSASVMYQGNMVSPTLSLDHLKLIYGIQGEVEHNALTDANDLMCVHQAYVQGRKADEKQIQLVVKQKEEKQEESKRKQQLRLQRLMRKRFASMKHRVSIQFLPEVLDQFHSWYTRDSTFRLQFKKDRMIYESNVYEYQKLSLQLLVCLEESVPYVTLLAHYEDEVFEKRYLLTYRNASAIEQIIKRLEA